MDERRNLQGDLAVAESLDQMYNFNSTGGPIGAEQIRKARDTMQEYKRGKANLEQKLIENEKWYKLRHWEVMRKSEKNMVEPASAWLFNAIANKHADAMDNAPAPNILPREEGDVQEAKMLSSVIPVILQQRNFEETYSRAMYDKLKNGTAAYGVFWNPELSHGLGDVDVRRIDLLNLFWEPGIEDIQQSRNIFYAYLRDNEELEERYPQLRGQLGGKTMELATYAYDDAVDTAKKSLMVDWYYKRRSQEGRSVLHLCQFVSGWKEPLFASENDAKYADGWYEDGEYPFVFDVLFPVNGTPCGFGYVDIDKGAQEYIDRADQAIMQSLLAGARPRYMYRVDGAINEEEFADYTKTLVHVNGSIGKGDVERIDPPNLPAVYVTVLNNKIQELKETSGNRDVSNGGTTGGATAASAIAAMMEAGGKLSRDSNKGAFRAFSLLVLKVIERIRQGYTVMRCFRITGEDGGVEFTRYSNAGLLPQAQGELVNGRPMEMGTDVGYRLPLFDIQVTIEKASAYSRLAQNELALQFYGVGMFLPQNSDNALSCLEMMDFDRKDSVMQRIAQNGTLYQQLMAAQQTAIQMANMMDPTGRTAQGLMARFGMNGDPALTPGVAAMPETGAGESSVTKKAREQAAQTTAPA